jgi:hypothetical protein
MGYNVIVSGPRTYEYAEAEKLELTDSGHLRLADSDGGTVALYAPGIWNRVERTNQAS